eukprot:3588937-Pyramimonas_sp.AAC.1
MAEAVDPTAAAPAGHGLGLLRRLHHCHGRHLRCGRPRWPHGHRHGRHGSSPREKSRLPRWICRR